MGITKTVHGIEAEAAWLKRELRRLARPLEKRIRTLRKRASELLWQKLNGQGIIIVEDANCPGNFWATTRKGIERMKRNGCVPFEVGGLLRSTADGGCELFADGEWHGVIGLPWSARR